MVMVITIAPHTPCTLALIILCHIPMLGISKLKKLFTGGGEVVGDIAI